MFAVAILLFVLALIALATGVLGLIGRLPGNRYIGVHTEAALRDETAFRTANRIAAPTSLVSGALLAAGGLVVLAAGTLTGLVVTAGVLVIALFTLGAGANAGARAAEAIAPPTETGGCGGACGGCSLKSTCEPAAESQPV
ncbi:SdpI family protein [Nocardia carnea]|uniref:SdpI family protein n=1 Tax=Nocardia carnea TaxID=37328 RepID=UPI00245700EE|nr:SdpI family protein [Nocardia carnea]